MTSNETPTRISMPTVIRPFGHFERYQEALYYNGQYCGTAVTCRYLIPNAMSDTSRHEDVRSHFTQAVAATVLEHGMLQVGIAFEDTKQPRWIKLDRIDLNEMIEWRVMDQDDYSIVADQSLTDQLDRDFTHLDSRPAWRMAALRPKGAPFLDVQFNLRHTNADGTSSKIFHSELLKHLNNPKADSSHLGLDGHILKLPVSGVNYPPPMHEMCHFTTSDTKKAKPVSTTEPEQTETQKSWGGYKEAPVKTERRTVRIPASKATKIIEACRQRQTTFTGLLHGICFASFLVRTADTIKRPSFNSTTAINTRRFLTKPVGMAGAEFDPEKIIANLVSVVEHVYTEEEIERLEGDGRQDLIDDRSRPQLEDIVWKVAAAAREDIEARLQRGFEDDPIDSLKSDPDWRWAVSELFDKPRRETWLVTNLGAMEGGSSEEADEGRWRIGRATFSLSAQTSKPLFIISATSVKDGDMCVDLNWQADLNDYVEKIAAGVVADLYSWLNYIATSEWREEKAPSAFDLDKA